MMRFSGARSKEVDCYRTMNLNRLHFVVPAVFCVLEAQPGRIHFVEESGGFPRNARRYIIS